MKHKLLNSLNTIIKNNHSNAMGLGRDTGFSISQNLLWKKEIKRASEKAGLHPIRVHDLRHSHASMPIELGFTPFEIADLLEHKSVKITLDTYSHLYPDKDRKPVDRLNQFRRMPPAES